MVKISKNPGQCAGKKLFFFFYTKNGQNPGQCESRTLWNTVIAHEEIEGEGNCFFRNISFFLLIIKTIVTFLDKYFIYIYINNNENEIFK